MFLLKIISNVYKKTSYKAYWKKSISGDKKFKSFSHIIYLYLITNKAVNHMAIQSFVVVLPTDLTKRGLVSSSYFPNHLAALWTLINLSNRHLKEPRIKVFALFVHEILIKCFVLCWKLKRLLSLKLALCLKVFS